MQNIYLIGFMGTGKSTLARCLRRMYGMEVVEMDELLVRREGMPISEIFESRGEEYFRERETALLMEMQTAENTVISCGGGVPMRERNVAEMKKNGRIVLLSASPEIILERTKDDHSRPLLENNKSVEGIKALMDKRQEKYEAAADIIVDTDGKGTESLCHEIMEALQKR